MGITEPGKGRWGAFEMGGLRSLHALIVGELFGGASPDLKTVEAITRSGRLRVVTGLFGIVFTGLKQLGAVVETYENKLDVE